MALSDTTNVTQPEKEKPISEVNKHEKREKPPTKVIIRRLPPGITQEEFISQVSPLPDYDYMYTVKGDMSLGENSFSRVYINFIKSEDVYMFKEKFDNYVFVDVKGHEYAAVVEFAAFQKIPKKRGKPRPDPKIATIENDPIYLEFLESLKQQPNQEEKPEFSYQPSNESKNESSTPLLDYLKQRKIDKLKSREEKREERRKREIERKKLREEERRKRFEEKSPAKTISLKSSSHSKSDVTLTDKSSDKSETKTIKEEEGEKEKNTEKVDKTSDKQAASSHKTKEVKKYDDYKSNTKYKTKYSTRADKYESYDKRDYKPRREDYRDRERRGRYEDNRKEDYKKEETAKKETEVKQFPKKVKKYSERREERKYEVRKAEQKKDDFSNTDDNKQLHEQEKDDDNSVSSKLEQLSLDKVENEETAEEANIKEELRRSDSKEDDKSDDQDKLRNKENDPRVQRRIRNKDRPTMQLYQPGMLSKRRQQEDDRDSKEASV